MAPAKKKSTKVSSIVMDGNLEKTEALSAMRLAAQNATEVLPKALAKCKTDKERQKVIGDRDTVVLAYLNALEKSLIHTGPIFENVAKDLEKEAKKIKKTADTLQTVSDAIQLLSQLVKLAASLALAFA